ncbi:hypothetical protein K7X08_012389 [Anisodus acutangulus]|uniref:Uncharacterized protein n=1 Tax=Anisodus acutangulus TaxID=402998 RepID=A0A9Q1LD23_9SOLA|nr:hypothetical protein K7X08_012389 [Anisodus acutangulus]
MLKEYRAKLFDCGRFTGKPVATGDWFTGILNILMIGLGIGVLVSVIHGGLRNSEGLFVDEDTLFQLD